MSPKIESGQLCTVEPVEVEKLAVGDIVLCKVNGNGPNAVFGRLTKVEP